MIVRVKSPSLLVVVKVLIPFFHNIPPPAVSNGGFNYYIHPTQYQYLHCEQRLLIIKFIIYTWTVLFRRSAFVG